MAGSSSPSSSWRLEAETERWRFDPTEKRDFHGRWTDDNLLKIRELIKQREPGNLDDVLAIGKAVRESVENDPEVAEAQKTYDEKVASYHEALARLEVARHTPDYTAAWEMTTKGEGYLAAKERYPDAVAEVVKLQKEVSDLGKDLPDKQKLMELRRKKVNEMLRKIRPFGVPKGEDVTDRFISDNPRLTKAVIRGLSSYPTEWVRRSLDYGPIRLVQAKKGARAVYEGRGTKSAMTVNQSRSAIIHELAHRMEDAHHRISLFEGKFYKRRTEGEYLRPLGRGYAPSERTRPDHFVDPYVGVDYDNDVNYEILSMGMEHGLADLYGTRWWSDDPELIDFVLGLLASA